LDQPRCPDARERRFNSHDSRTWFGGMGGGVSQDLVKGRVLGDDRIALPKDGASLQSAFNDCLSKRPAQTDPPPR